MRWITFLILLYLAASAQGAQLLGFPYNGSYHWPRVEYLLILSVFYALYAQESAAPLCGFIAGAAMDVTLNQTLGINAVPLALTTWIITRIRLSIFREHFVSQLLMTFVGTLIFTVLSIVLRSITRNAVFVGNSPGLEFANSLGNALYSAVLAPLLMFLMFRFGPLLGFTPQGPRSRIHS